ncbi:AP2-like ethylene-responsive transcription factor AIL6 [Tanacetum coccineum]|uniref:AP2-like ethylene-responsive transcription factor AIL6 n=1 Tax=Tanacetum coccineum TaxID=301880 RepID=A0ABQ5HUK4_9ASTR
MANDNKWLSFSLSPMEMFTSATSQPQQYYFNDTNHFYANNGWTNNSAKPTTMYTNTYMKDGADSPHFRSFMESHMNQPPAPKLEDFLGGDNTTQSFRYTDMSQQQQQTETQDSSTLTHMYDGNNNTITSVYFSDQQDNNSNNLNGINGFQTFSANSGSEVDDSATHVTAEFVNESGNNNNNELAYVQCPMNALSLGMNSSGASGGGGAQQVCEQKAIVAVEASDQNNVKKAIGDTFGQRTSIYRGVTRHRWTGRYEAHLWDNSCRREGQARKGRQGGYDKEDKAARAYDLAALKYWGPTATTNFPVANYAQELQDMKNATKQEFIASLRRKSSGFSRGASIYRGVTRHHQQGRWQARIGRVAGNKDLYLGTFATEEEAAEAYDIAAIKFRGMNAVTNFEMNRYDVEAISSSSLPVGGSGKRLKVSTEAEQKSSLISNHQLSQYSSGNTGNNISFGGAPPVYALPYDPNSTSQMYHHQSLFHHLQSGNGGAVPETSSAMALLPPPAEFFIWPNQSY